jgi:hypothetical protein
VVCIVHLPGVGHAVLWRYKKIARRAALIIPGTFNAARTELE